MTELEKLLEFVRFTHAAHTVERVARIPGTQRYATLAEHSYQLALVAWYVVDAHDLPLDKDKVLRYAILHDIVET